MLDQVQRLLKLKFWNIARTLLTASLVDYVTEVRGIPYFPMVHVFFNLKSVLRKKKNASPAVV